MKKNLLFLALFITSAVCVNAQWVTENTAFVKPSRGIRNISIVNANTVWVSTYNGAGSGGPSHDFSRTINGGTTWIAYSIKTIPAIAAVNNISNICAVGQDTAWACMYGDNTASVGGIYYTTNGGLTWTKQTTAAFNVGSFPDFVYFFDKNKGIAFGDPNTTAFEIYTTTDGGTTWTVVPSANIPAPLASGEYGNVNAYATNGSTIWAATTAGRVLKSTDMGVHWTAAVISTPGVSVNKIVFKDATHGLATVGAKNDSLMRTSDGGATWALVAKTGRFLHSDICYASGTNAMYICTGAATGLTGTSYSLDDGTTWKTQDTIAQHTAVSFLNTNTGWTGGFNTSATVGGIFKWTSSTIMGVHENQQMEAGLNVYPNPNDGHFQIALKDASGKPVQVLVFDITGKVVFDASEANGNSVFVKDLDLSSYSHGMYFVQIRDGEKTSTKKIIVQ
jgi:photosystem II stability/assembly factor-like uncharacterized protein